MQIDHIGYAVKNIEKAKPHFETLGFSFEETFTDNDRNIYICFGNNGEYRIELIQPIGSGESPVDMVLKNNGPMPYHICYITSDIEKEIETLNKKHFIVSSLPAKAVAFGGKRVAFLYNAKIGIIELVEQ